MVKWMMIRAAEAESAVSNDRTSAALMTHLTFTSVRRDKGEKWGPKERIKAIEKFLGF